MKSERGLQMTCEKIEFANLPIRIYELKTKEKYMKNEKEQTVKNVEDYYPITTISYPDGHELKVILRKHLEDYTPPIKLSSLYEALDGSTGISEGVYPCDVEAWLNNQDIND